MKSFLKKVKACSFIEALVSIVFGILFIACPDFTKSTICYLFASLIVVMGLMKCTNYFIYGIEPFGFVHGVIDIALGTLIFSIIPTLVEGGIFGLIFGVIFIVNSLFNIQWAFDCRRVGVKNWWIIFTLALIILGFGIALVCYRSVEKVLIIILGVCMIVQGIYDLIDAIVISAKVKKVKKSLKQLFTILPENYNDQIEEAEVVEDDKE